MVLKKRLKNKEICYLEDPILMHIDYNLYEGDMIFKKINLKQSIQWVKEELRSIKNFEIGSVINKIDEGFIDVIKGPSKKKIEYKKFSKEDVEKFMFMLK